MFLGLLYIPRIYSVSPRINNTCLSDGALTATLGVVEHARPPKSGAPRRVRDHRVRRTAFGDEQEY